ncbi:hypothetical protein DL769_006884 [Monosporascus sp. CRB-8-3]|nr:hypothetical protein DL769_006884 [Monosporascus sp. CRB-8-3]
MLGRANKDYRASRPPTTGNPALAKQLFPSSSPAAQDGNIVQSFKNVGGKVQPSARSVPLKAVGDTPLSISSNNVAQPYPKSFSETESNKNFISSNSVASLCNTGSFTDEVATVTAAGNSHARIETPVYISVDDFSDDDNLQLDYECPGALPVPPPVTKPTTQVTPNRPPVQPAAPSSTPLPWSSSPQEHLFPPSNPHRQTLKRPSFEEPQARGPPAAKKRTLPKSFGREYATKQIDEDDTQGLQAALSRNPVSTPAPKSEKLQPWDMTQSAYKERQGKLKAANKKSESETGHTAAQIKANADSHGRQKAHASAISLSSEQQHVKDLVVRDNQSVFFTGPAGTGKSVLMRAIIQDLKKKWARDPERLSITASTGLAACNIGGMTLHSFAGIGLGKEDVPTLVKKIRRNPKAKNRWLRTNALIIDEVSMVDGDLFDKLAQIARTIRNNGRPWGGIQLVITGDFFQLPPVPEGAAKKDIKFAFEAATWNTSIDHTIGLTQVFRQKDSEFAAMLNEMRLGRISEQTVQAFKRLARPLSTEDGLAATELFPTRQEVERSNESRLNNLPGSVRRFEAVDSGGADPNIRDKLLQNMMAPKAIDLKKGAQVMLIKNMDDTLVNGSLGKVIGFSSAAAFEFFGDRDGEGGSGDEKEINSLSKRKINSFSRDPVAVKDLKEYPIVQFTATDGTHRILLCEPEDWKVELPNGEVQAQRKQLPLILAWALSIHKAQGQTLERVKVDLGKVFEKGQAYVALSRATSQEGLQVLRFDKNKVVAHPRVINFYNKLYSAESALKTKKPAAISDFATKGSTAALGRKGASKYLADLDDEEEAMATFA